MLMANYAYELKTVYKMEKNSSVLKLMRSEISLFVKYITEFPDNILSFFLLFKP